MSTAETREIGRLIISLCDFYQELLEKDPKTDLNQLNRGLTGEIKETFYPLVDETRRQRQRERTVDRSIDTMAHLMQRQINLNVLSKKARSVSEESATLKKYLKDPGAWGKEELDRSHFKETDLSTVDGILVALWKKEARVVLETKAEKQLNESGKSIVSLQGIAKERQEDQIAMQANALANKKLQAFQSGKSLLSINAILFEESDFKPTLDLKRQIKGIHKRIEEQREGIKITRERVRAAITIAKTRNIPLENVSKKSIDGFLRQKKTQEAALLKKTSDEAFKQLITGAPQPKVEPAVQTKKKKRVKKSKSLLSQPKVEKTGAGFAPLSVTPLLPEAKVSSRLNMCVPGVRLHSRIKRWETGSKEEMRLFKDYNPQGELVNRYAVLSDEELEQQHLYHRLHGIERLLSLSDLMAKYSFCYKYKNALGEVRLGKGLYAELTVGDKTVAGVIHIGVSKRVVYHALFSPLPEHVESGACLVNQLDESAEKEEEESGDWQKGNCLFKMEEDGRLLMCYEDGAIFTLYPLE